MELTTSTPPAPDLSCPVRIELPDGVVFVGYLEQVPKPIEEFRDGLTFTYTFTPSG